MWKKPFGYAEYLLIGLGLTFTGVMLQIVVGAINWKLMAFPVNLILLGCFLAALVVIHLLRAKVYLFRCLSETPMAVVSLSFVAALTLLMGLIKQDGAADASTGMPSFGLRAMLSAWWFVLPYLWMTICLGLTALRRTLSFQLSDTAFLLNHWGLFIVLTCATLGNADIQQLNMQTQYGNPEWRAYDDNGKITELPLAIELQQFAIEQYPARFMVIDNSTGKALPEGKPQLISAEDKKGTILDWDVKLERYMEYAAPVETKDTIKYVAWGSSGATDAALITAVNRRTHQVKKGWISCGSYLFPFNVLKLNKHCSLVMAEREPKKFSSAVKVYTEDKEVFADTVEVNKPLEAMGWKIYQLDYDKEKGRWSETSIFKLVRDPWLPAVYVGIFMMLAGAVGLFLHKKEK